MYVKSVQIKGGDQRAVFAGVLDYTTITLSRLSIVLLEEFTRVRLGQENPRRSEVKPREPRSPCLSASVMWCHRSKALKGW